MKENYLYYFEDPIKGGQSFGSVVELNFKVIRS